MNKVPLVGIAPCLLRLTQCYKFAYTYQEAASLPDPGASILLIAQHMRLEKKHIAGQRMDVRDSSVKD